MRNFIEVCRKPWTFSPRMKATERSVFSKEKPRAISPRNFILACLMVAVFFAAAAFLQVSASEQETNCQDRYLTLINPVRGRNLWKDQSTKPLSDQYNLVSQYNFSATWLLQYDALADKELFPLVQAFNSKQEIGAFLEVSPALANAARIIYPYDAAWSEPQAIFLSGYPQSDRRRLIDTLFKAFKKKFGYFPKSVGAWWIDSYSLNYIKEKYSIKSALIVADQQSTDHYGVWGQWWGVPYYPTQANILTPAGSLKDKLDVVILQWAQRDLSLAYGDGSKYSNYSLQANDYTNLGKDTQYFEKLIKVYLDCKNPVAQITVGLETGIESVDNLDEYKKQLLSLREVQNLKSVTMGEFAGQFERVYPEFPAGMTLKDGDVVWDLNTESRSNSKLGDLVFYKQQSAFKDYFLPDKSNFLDRRLKETTKTEIAYLPWFLVVILATGVIMAVKRQIRIWLFGSLFAIAAFGLILRSHYQFGWQIFYGPVVSPLNFWQIVLVLISYVYAWLLFRIKSIPKLVIWLIPLLFGFDFILQNLRASFISGRYYFGWAADNLKFIGFSFEKPWTFRFENTDFPNFLAAGLLRFDFNSIWENIYLALVIYPLAHILIAVIPGFILVKLTTKVRKIVLFILVILFLFHLINIFQADPHLVQ